MNLLDQYPRDGKNEGRCACFVCTPYADGCEGEAAVTAVGSEVSVELCRACFDDHRDKALAVLEERL